MVLPSEILLLDNANLLSAVPSASDLFHRCPGFLHFSGKSFAVVCKKLEAKSCPALRVNKQSI